MGPRNEYKHNSPKHNRRSSRLTQPAKVQKRNQEVKRSPDVVRSLQVQGNTARDRGIMVGSVKDKRNTRITMKVMKQENHYWYKHPSKMVETGASGLPPSGPQLDVLGFIGDVRPIRSAGTSPANDRPVNNGSTLPTSTSQQPMSMDLASFAMDLEHQISTPATGDPTDSILDNPKSRKIAKSLEAIRSNLTSIKQRLSPYNQLYPKIWRNLLSQKLFVTEDQVDALLWDLNYLRQSGRGGDDDNQLPGQIEIALNSAVIKLEDLRLATIEFFPDSATSNPSSQHVSQYEDLMRGTTEDLELFQELSCKLHRRNEPDLLVASENGDALKKFAMTRSASAVLCEQLNQLCVEHPEHRIYFSLDINGMNEMPSEARFHLAFESTAREQGDLLWFRAHSMITTQAISRSPAVSIQEYQMSVNFCLGQLSGAQDREMRITVGTNQLFYPASRKAQNINPVLLSDLIAKGPYLKLRRRVRLAKLISEAVLKLNPNVWLGSNLKSEHVIISDEDWEPHLSVTLVRSEADRSDHTTSQSGPQIGQVLLRLGTIFLELGLWKRIPDEPGTVDIHTKFADKPYEGQLGRQLGHVFAKVVKYCLENTHRAEELYNREAQYDFYKEVIRPLEDAESLLE